MADHMFEQMIEILGTPELDAISSYDWLRQNYSYTKPQTIEIDSLLENHIWITAKRKKLFVREMKIKHIKNCINCLEGKSNTKIPQGYLGGKDKWIKIFNQELINRQ